MSSGHIARAVGGGSAVDSVLHLPLVVDGAHGFVFLSGVSVALADTSRVGRGQALKARCQWVLSRALFIYLLHLLLTFGAYAAFALTDFPPFVPERALEGALVVDVLTFQALVSLMDVLPLYVVYLLVTPLVLWLRDRRSLWGVAAVSGAVYIASQFEPALSSIRAGADADVAWVLGSWQILYFGGLLCGLHWWRMRDFLFGTTGRRILVFLGVGPLALVVATRATFALTERSAQASPAWRLTIEENFIRDKALLPPEQLVFVVSLGVATYAAVVYLNQRFESKFLTLRRMGSRSLRVYLGSCVMVVLAALAFGELNPLQRESVVVASLILLAVVGWPRTVARGKPWSL